MWGVVFRELLPHSFHVLLVRRSYAMTNVTGAQLGSITPSMWSEFTRSSTYYESQPTLRIDVAAMASLTHDQIDQWTSDSIYSFSAEQLQGLTSTQMSWMDSAQKDAVKNVMHGNYPSSDDDGGHHSTSGSGSGSGHTHHKKNSGGLSGGALAGIIIAAVAVLAVGMFFMYTKFVKQRDDIKAGADLDTSPSVYSKLV